MVVHLILIPGEDRLSVFEMCQVHGATAELAKIGGSGDRVPSGNENSLFVFGIVQSGSALFFDFVITNVNDRFLLVICERYR